MTLRYRPQSSPHIPSMVPWLVSGQALRIAFIVPPGAVPKDIRPALDLSWGPAEDRTVVSMVHST